jgi:hypothetical protein
MRFLVRIIAAAALLATPAVVQADDRAKALEILERAIKAHGGTEALNKAQMRSRTGEGAVTLGGETRLNTEETVRFPDRCRVELVLQGRNRVLLVITGDKGWMQAGGGTQEMTKTDLKEKQEELYVWWLMNLTPLVKDEFQLKPLPDVKVNGQDAAAIQASRKDSPDVRLFFDKKSNLLIKIARRARLSGLPVTEEYYYSDHKEFDGVKMPTKEVILVNGANKLSEVKYNKYKVLSQVEDKIFEKP